MDDEPKDVIAVEKRRQQEFAARRMRELVGQGLSQKEAELVLRAAGPVCCLKAAEWGKQVFEHLMRPLKNGYGGTEAEKIPAEERRFAVIDLLDCLLTGVGGRNGFGKERMERALRALNIAPPDAPSSIALFAVLRGARALIVAANAPVRGADSRAIKSGSKSTRSVLCPFEIRERIKVKGPQEAVFLELPLDKIYTVDRLWDKPSPRRLQGTIHLEGEPKNYWRHPSWFVRA